MKPHTGFPYRRLPGTLRGFIRRASLWEGPDHLLSVTGTRFSEEYRRFYYRDIEAIVIRKCPRAGSLGVWGVSVFVCLIALIRAVRFPGATVAWAIVCSLFAFLVFRLALSLFYSSRCYIQTAVSREELPSLLRERSTKWALARVRKKIEEAQGLLPEDITALREAPAAVEPPQETAEAALESEIAKRRSGDFTQVTELTDAGIGNGVRFAIAAFILLLADAFESFWFLDAPAQVAGSFGLRLFTILLVLAEAATIVPGLVSIHRSRTLRPLRTMLFLCLAFLGLEVWFSLYFRQIYMAQPSTTHAAASFNYVWHWVQVVAGCVAIVLGIGGLILVLLNWENYRRGDLSTV
jgi:hypothetical protein